MKNSIILWVALLATLPAFAQNWTGAVNSDWNNVANWSAAPGNGDDIEIDPANYTGAMAQPVVTGASNFTPAEMLVQHEAELTIAGTLNASDRVEVLGAGTFVRIDSGTFALTGSGNNGRLIFAEESQLEMTGGNLQVSQRLLFELGAIGTIDAGNITVAETIALIDGGISGSSKLVQHGGTITANAEFGFENEAGTYYPRFEQTGGILNINGNLLWLGAAPGAGRGYFTSSGGTITVTGTIVNDPTSTMNLHIALSGTAVFNHTGTQVGLLAGDSIAIADGAVWTDVHTVSWTNNGVLHATANGLFTAGNTILTGTGTYQFGDLTIPTGQSLTLVTPSSISISGDWEISGTFSNNAHEIILNGLAPQTFSATNPLTLYDLTINHTGSGITVLDQIRVSHALQLIQGVVIVDESTSLFLPDNATITGGSDSSFVEGYLEKAGDEAIEFPLGKSPDRYRPLAISAPSSAAAVVRVAYRPMAYSFLTPVEAPLQSVSALEYWDLSQTGSTDPFTATVGWNNASESGLTDCADISMTVWNGSQWSFVASTTTGLCDADNAGMLNSSVALPVVGPLTIAFTNNVYQRATELCPGDSLIVDTNTYTISGIYTDVLQDINGEDSTIVSILTVLAPLSVSVTNYVLYLEAAAPNATHYQWIDCNANNLPIAGATAAQFYPTANGSYAVIASRDNCTDTDTSACELIVQLGIASPSLTIVQLYPNPVTGNGALQLMASAALRSIALYTTDGRLIQRYAIFAAAGEMISIALPNLTSGTYLLLAETSAGSSANRFVVAH
jgi:hypothetical protein